MAAAPGCSLAASGCQPAPANSGRGPFQARLGTSAIRPGSQRVGGETIVEIPDPGQLALALAKIEGLVQEQDGELRAGCCLPRGVKDYPPRWNPYGRLCSRSRIGTRRKEPAGRSARGILIRRPAYWRSFCSRACRSPSGPVPRKWKIGSCNITPIGKEPARSLRSAAHPASERGPIIVFLLGLAYALRLVQIGHSPQGGDVVRLSPLGRWLLGVAEKPPDPATYPKTILVQPNLEIVVYRQGLTPGLIASLSAFAAWKSLGSVCMLQLEPETVYRALEGGWTFESILQTLEQYGMHPTPPAVIESLRTWANKRDRLTIYPSAALFEFADSAELDEALARGLPAVRLTERLAVVHDESAVDYPALSPQRYA